MILDTYHWKDDNTNYKCEIAHHRIQDYDYYCGYVYIPSKHRYYITEDYDSIPVEVYGGLTFKDKGKVGFDCMHTIEDIMTTDKKDIDFVMAETIKLAKQLKKLE